MLSGYQDLTDSLAVMGNVVWQQWSQFGEPSLQVSSTTDRKATVNLNYDDTWGFALGGPTSSLRTGCGRWASPSTPRR